MEIVARNPTVSVMFSLLSTPYTSLMVRILLYKFVRDIAFLPPFFFLTLVTVGETLPTLFLSDRIIRSSLCSEAWYIAHITEREL